MLGGPRVERAFLPVLTPANSIQKTMKDLAIFAAKVVAVLIVVKLLKPSLPAAVQTYLP